MKDAFFKTFPFRLFFALLVSTFIFIQCTKNQTDNKKDMPGDHMSGDTIHLPEFKITPNWYCSTIHGPDDRTQRAVGGKTKFWPTGTVLKIGFLGGTAAQITAVKSYAAEWTGPSAANLTFSYPTTGPYDIRVAFNSSGGAWSYVGTDARVITSQTSPTINLGWIGPDVVKHEFGHAIGLYHEHQNPNGGICWNEANVIASLSGPPNNWSVAQIRFNVLDKLDASTVLTTPWDRTSIMHYNIPSNWTCNNVAIPGGAVISQTDKDFIKARYPGGTTPPVTSVTLTAAQVDNIIALLNARKIESDTNAARITRTVADVKKILNR